MSVQLVSMSEPGKHPAKLFKIVVAVLHFVQHFSKILAEGDGTDLGNYISLLRAKWPRP